MLSRISDLVGARIGDYVFRPLAIPMAAGCGLAFARYRTIRVPRGFGIWLLFLV